MSNPLSRLGDLRGTRIGQAVPAEYNCAGEVGHESPDEIWTL